MLHININTIPHKDQRYPTVGDWMWDKDNLYITVSDMGNWKYELLVAFHEIIEVMLCKDRNISQEEVDAFDIKFESLREKLNLSDDMEPGNEKTAPYHREHTFATLLETLMAYELGVDWEEYDKKVMSL